MNADPSINSADDGITIDRKLLPANVSSSIRCNREGRSNPINARFEHLEKHALPKTNTEAGRTIAFKPLFENADSSIRSNLELFSNVTHSNAKHLEKHDLHKTCTFRGIVMNFKLFRENTTSAIVVNCDPNSNTIAPIAHVSSKLDPGSPLDWKLSSFI
jgi:hypothetical protein